ncbi:MAG TPA: hypothetical protein VG389_07240 [Myxococcota bacterium]|nr:hypothetical protein [Myxococcota bacterium]
MRDALGHAAHHSGAGARGFGGSRNAPAAVSAGWQTIRDRGHRVRPLAQRARVMRERVRGWIASFDAAALRASLATRLLVRRTTAGAGAAATREVLLAGAIARTPAH